MVGMMLSTDYELLTNIQMDSSPSFTKRRGGVDLTFSYIRKFSYFVVNKKTAVFQPFSSRSRGTTQVFLSSVFRVYQQLKILSTDLTSNQLEEKTAHMRQKGHSDKNGHQNSHRRA